jgi:hypothetical protein
LEVAERKVRLTQRVVEAARPEVARYALSDTDIPGFRLLVWPSGRRGFYFRYRVGGGRAATVREPKIGEVPARKAEAARAIASDWAAQVRLGGDPSGKRQSDRKAPTMTELFERYLADHARPNEKASSLVEDERLIKDCIKPAFARRKVLEVKRAEVDRFHKNLAGKPYLANRALALLSKAFNLAEMWGWRPDASNPCRHVKKFAETKRRRFLSPKALPQGAGPAGRGVTDRRARWGACPAATERLAREGGAGCHIPPSAVAAVRLLALTGARKGEILGL